MRRPPGEHHSEQQQQQQQQQQGQPSQTVNTLVARRLREDPNYNEEAQLDQVIASSYMSEPVDPQLQAALAASLETEHPLSREEDERRLEGAGLFHRSIHFHPFIHVPPSTARQ